MIVTLTELGPRRYLADFLRGSRRRRLILTAGLHRCITQRGVRVWTMRDCHAALAAGFGEGGPGQQAQYRIRRKRR